MVALLPFSSHREAITLKGDLQLSSEHLIELSFSLQDPAQKVSPPLKAATWQEPLRAHGLWRHTCFEAFFARPGESAYWEVNLSPEGKWNLYTFSNYRSPQLPQESLDFTLTKFQTEGGALHAVLASTLSFQELEYSLCAVLKVKDETLYYSTAHKGEKPDFHLRESFTHRRGAL